MLPVVVVAQTFGFQLAAVGVSARPWLSSWLGTSSSSGADALYPDTSSSEDKYNDLMTLLDRRDGTKNRTRGRSLA
jgi:hypothetical protein